MSQFIKTSSINVNTTIAEKIISQLSSSWKSKNVMLRKSTYLKKLKFMGLKESNN
jgi:DTW domain-containing protein YfiP